MSVFQRNKRPENKPLQAVVEISEIIEPVNQEYPPVDNSPEENSQAPISEISVSLPLNEIPAESPVSQRINEMVETAFNPPEGWRRLKEAPVDGTRVMVSETGLDRGVLVYWRVSKYVDKTNLRYVPRGRWTDFTSLKDIEFAPKCWKPYDPEEFWPLQG